MTALIRERNPYAATLTVPNRVESVRPAVAFLVQTARALKIPKATDTIFEVALTEAVSNAVRHGRGNQPDAVIRCELELREQSLTIRIVDGGGGFALPERGLPEVEAERVDALPEAGYGLPIIQKVFDVVRTIEVDGRFGVELCLRY